jgi:hypothetical protein
MHLDTVRMRAIDERVVEGELRVLIPIRNYRLKERVPEDELKVLIPIRSCRHHPKEQEPEDGLMEHCRSLGYS